MALFTCVDILHSKVAKIKQHWLAFAKAHSLFLSRVNPDCLDSRSYNSCPSLGNETSVWLGTGFELNGKARGKTHVHQEVFCKYLTSMSMGAKLQTRVCQTDLTT